MKLSEQGRRRKKQNPKGFGRAARRKRRRTLSRNREKRLEGEKLVGERSLGCVWSRGHIGWMGKTLGWEGESPRQLQTREGKRGG